MNSRARWISLALLIALLPAALRAQELTRLDRERGLLMLDVVRDDIRKNYFDTTYGGVNLAAVFDTARSRIQHATALGQVIGAIAQATLEFNDSHTGFLPPGLVYRADYGWEVRFVGDTCRVFRVMPGSDAEAKGMRLGDAVLSIEGYRLSRQNLWPLQYLLNAVQPRSVLRMILQSPGAQPRTLDIAAKVVERRRIVDLQNSFDLGELVREGEKDWDEEAPRWWAVKDQVVVWRLHHFYTYNDWVDDLLKSARKHQAIVLDLRGNSGGAVRSLRRLLEGLYAEKITIADQVMRQKHEPLIVEGKGDDQARCEIVVLVDAASASASEIFARTIQLTRRGKVLGDRSEGAVRESRTYVHSAGTQTAVFYAASVTIADLVMPDGGKLENVGVLPDEIVLPTGDDLREKRDPALARALSLVGVARTPEEAGRLVWSRSR